MCLIITQKAYLSGKTALMNQCSQKTVPAGFMIAVVFYRKSKTMLQRFRDIESAAIVSGVSPTIRWKTFLNELGSLYLAFQAISRVAKRASGRVPRLGTVPQVYSDEFW